MESLESIGARPRQAVSSHLVERSWSCRVRPENLSTAWVQRRGGNRLSLSRKRRQTKPLGFLMLYFETRRSNRFLPFVPIGESSWLQHIEGTKPYSVACPFDPHRPADLPSMRASVAYTISFSIYFPNKGLRDSAKCRQFKRFQSFVTSFPSFGRGSIPVARSKIVDDSIALPPKLLKNAYGMAGSVPKMPTCSIPRS